MTLWALALAMLVAGIYGVGREQRFVDRALETLGSGLSETAAMLCVDPILAEDYPLLDTYVDSLTRGHHGVAFARVYRADGTKVAWSSSPEADALWAAGECRTFRAPIRVRVDDLDDQIGVVELGLDARPFLHQKRERSLDHVWIALATFTVLALVLGLGIRVWVGTPLRRLTAHAHALGEGDLDTEITLQASDELGELARTLDVMRLRLRQSHAELRDQNEALRIVDRMRAEFVANMSHEVRTPLNGILGTAQLLRESSLDPDQRDLVDVLLASSKHLRTIVDDILDLSKMQGGRLELEAQPVDPTALLEDVVDLFAASAAQKGLELVCDPAPDLPASVLADGTRLRQVLGNLLGNAIKFTDAGMVRVAVRLEDAGDRGARLRFSVADTGIGVRPQDKERIFEAFAQADSSTTRTHGGTGLGLTISQQLVERMGGTLELKSEPARGSEFAFTLELPMLACTTVLAPLAGCRALVVESDGGSREAIVHQLGRLGLEGESVPSWQSGFERALELERAGERLDLMVVSRRDEDCEAIDGALANEAPLAALPVLLLVAPDGRPDHWPPRRDTVVLTRPARPSRLKQAVLALLGEGAPVRSASRVGVVHDDAYRVLLVEDNPINQRVARGMLQRLGVRFDIATDGAQAIEQCRREPYDLILMDCQMPGMDGYRATAEIRAMEGEGRHTPIVAMTAYAMPGDRKKCLDAGMDDYLPKPVRLEALGEALARWCPHAPEP